MSGLVMPGLECAPGFERLSSCFRDGDVRRLIAAYNAAHPRDPLSASSSLAATLRRLHARMKCAGRDGCLADRLAVSVPTLRPRAPSAWTEPTDWLQTSDIEAVMMQYPRKFRNFRFLGVFPVDFASRNELGFCVGDFMCTLDAAALARKFDRFGAVFNLDAHHMPGSHWIACFAGLNPALPNYGVYLYDSYGGEMPREVTAFARQVAASLPGCPVAENERRHQREGGHCGVYCIQFLVAMLNGVPFAEYCASPSVNDRTAALMRRVYFRSKAAAAPRPPSAPKMV